MKIPITRMKSGPIPKRPPRRRPKTERGEREPSCTPYTVSAPLPPEGPTRDSSRKRFTKPKRKYSYTKRQEEKIMNDAMGILQWIAAIIAVLVVIFIAYLTIVFPTYGAIAISIFTLGYVLHKFLLAAIVIRHHGRVSSQDDNIIDNEDERQPSKTPHTIG